ncbi:hypothetical protein KI387_036567, partial [Taxus chinensis]
GLGGLEDEVVVDNLGLDGWVDEGVLEEGVGPRRKSYVLDSDEGGRPKMDGCGPNMEYVDIVLNRGMSIFL